MLTIKTKVMLASTAVFGTMLLALAFLVYRSVRDAETAKLDAHLEAQSEKLNRRSRSSTMKKCSLLQKTS